MTKVAREDARNPRLSTEERYGSRARDQGLVTDAATKMAEERYLLSEAAPLVVEHALGNWDELTRGTSLARK